jgi:hypothetical protein
MLLKVCGRCAAVFFFSIMLLHFSAVHALAAQPSAAAAVDLNLAAAGSDPPGELVLAQVRGD